MRAFAISAIVMISLGFSAFPGPTALGQEACRCKGCGCKGGPGAARTGLVSRPPSLRKYAARRPARRANRKLPRGSVSASSP